MPVPEVAKPPLGFVFQEPEGRPFRVVSIEVEVDGRGNLMAQDLYKHGLVSDSRVMAYGFFPDRHYTCLGFIKYDASVTGGEFVLDRINLTKEGDAGAVATAFERLYTLKSRGTIACNPNCGGHITIDAAGFGHYDILRLVALFGHLEEPIFRLAGAGCRYGHRSLYKGFDIANGGRGYANAIVKGPFKEQPNPFSKWMGQPRMSALNLTKVSHAGDMCGCGNRDILADRIYDHKNCICPSNTGGSPGRAIEWRVWNSVVNPRIVYAWIALMQAMHAYVWVPGDIPDYKEYSDLEPFEWSAIPYSKLPADKRRRAQACVEWMFSALPLTSLEKKALAYAYNRTPYRNWGKDFWRAIVNTPYKPPKFPNVYKTDIRRSIRIIPRG